MWKSRRQPIMVEPLDLRQVRRDQRRAAALLGLTCELFNHHSFRTYRHSFLPSTYWGKPRDVPPQIKPSLSFIRGELNQGKSSLPPINLNTNKEILSSKDNANQGGELERQDRNDKMGEGKATTPASQSLPLVDTKRSKDFKGNITKREKHIPLNKTLSYKKLPRLQSTLRSEQQSENFPEKGKIQQKVTIHVPNQDGASGHVTVQKLRSDGEVLPPLISIHSSAFISHTSTAENHFLYHHNEGSQRPNLPHFDTSVTTSSVDVSQGLHQSPLFQILSVAEERQKATSSPVNTTPGGPLSDSQLNLSAKASKRSRKVKKQKHYLGKDGEVVSHNTDSVDTEDQAVVSRISSPSLSLSEPYSALSHDGDKMSDRGADSVETWLKSALQLSEEKPYTVNEVYQQSQKLTNSKATALKTYKNVKRGNIHRQAYLAALSVARSQQLPQNPSLLSRRLTRPFKFSYFKHIPHQKPCCCVECRERLLTNSVTQQKSKKLSPVKSIFGKVKVEDYYPLQALVKGR